MCEREKYITCIHCKEPLADNDIVKDAYKMNTQSSWVASRVLCIADMLDGRDQAYIASMLREIIKEANIRLKY